MAIVQKPTGVLTGGLPGNTYGPPQKKKQNPVEDMYKVYNAAVKQQAGDYDDIMGRFKSLYGDPSLNTSLTSSFTPYNPDLARYNKSADTTKALADLEELAKTGGLSDADQQNLRARGVSPIRAEYANAQRDIDRQRRLGGGYSPNYGAVTSRMARDQSSLISDQLDKVNAGIAEMVQKGKLSAAPNYASAAQAESDLANKFEFANQEAKNQAKQFNLNTLFDLKKTDIANHANNKANLLKGMTDLYGTTPALPKLYGDQAMDTAKFQNEVNTNKKKNAISLLNGIVRK